MSSLRSSLLGTKEGKRREEEGAQAEAGGGSGGGLLSGAMRRLSTGDGAKDERRARAEARLAGRKSMDTGEAGSGAPRGEGSSRNTIATSKLEDSKPADSPGGKTWQKFD